MAKQEVDVRVAELVVRLRALAKNMEAMPEPDRFLSSCLLYVGKMEADVKHARDVYETRVARRNAVAEREEAARIMAEGQRRAEEEAATRAELGIPEGEVPPNGKSIASGTEEAQDGDESEITG